MLLEALQHVRQISFVFYLFSVFASALNGAAIATLEKIITAKVNINSFNFITSSNTFYPLTQF